MGFQILNTVRVMTGAVFFQSVNSPKTVLYDKQWDLVPLI